MKDDRYLTTQEVAALIRVEHTKHPRVAVCKFLKRNHVPKYGKGRLVLRSSVIEALEQEGKAWRKRQQRRRLNVVASREAS